MTLLKRSRCLTCLKLNGHIDLLDHRDAEKHQHDNVDHHVQISADVDPDQQPTKPLKLAPAIIVPKKHFSESRLAYVTADLYESVFEARLFFATDDYDVIWPASHDNDGFYTVVE